jgi:6-phosphogluconolactonase
MKQFSCLMILFFFFTNAEAQAKKYNLLIGTYTNACDSKGIYVYDFNTQTAKVTQKAVGTTINPSYLTISPDKKFVYSVNESGKGSKLSSFSYDAKSGAIQFLNTQDSQGADPCYIINDDKNVLVANYSGGTIGVFRKKPDGTLSEAVQVIKHEGKSSNAKRQEGPHVHMVYFSPDRKFVLSNDLGTDRIYVYRYYPTAEKQVLELQDTIPIKTGSGPRHLTFSPNGKFVYLIQELDGTITVFNYKDGKFKRLQETSVASKDFPGETGAADIHTSADGKFLYATNRGDANTISTFEIAASGRLTLKSTIATGGKGPRNFAIDPSGNFLLVAHQNSNEVIIFKRDAVTGLLTDSGKKIALCSPVCLVFDEVD